MHCGLPQQVHHVLTGVDGLSYLDLAMEIPDIVIISPALQGDMDAPKVHADRSSVIAGSHHRNQLVTAFIFL